MAKKKVSEAPAAPTKALATTATKAIAPRPAGTRIAGKGFENLEREDILIPRLLLLQPMSPQVTGDLEEEAGTIFLNLSNKSLGKEIVFTPILHYRSRIKWHPKDDGGGIDCSAPNARIPNDPSKYAETCSVCVHKEWDNEAEKKKDQQPKCTMYENFVIVVGDSNEPVVLSMERTKTKVAKKFYSMMALKGGDMFENQYKLGVVKEKSENDEAYFNYTVADVSKKTDAKRVVVLEKIWQSLSKATITTKEENPDAAAPQPAAAGAGNGKY